MLIKGPTLWDRKHLGTIMQKWFEKSDMQS